MPHDYDLDCLAPLRGLHLVGTVTRRFLISYPVDPRSLADWVPPGGELSLAHGCAWVSACFVHIDDMRPAGMPRSVGAEFHYLIHRTRARLPFPDGKAREAVLILEPNIDRPILARLGRWTAGVHFQVRDISMEESPEGWRVRMVEGEDCLFHAEIPRSSITAAIGPGSRFDGSAEADRFLLGVSYGGEWQRDRARLRLLAETHEPWETLTGSCRTHHNAFLNTLEQSSKVEADHVITMTGIPHYFAMRGVDVQLEAP